jgi:hypothetical protein
MMRSARYRMAVAALAGYDLVQRRRAAERFESAPLREVFGYEPEWPVRVTSA